MTRPSKAQKDTVERVMHAYRHGELHSGRSGRTVRDRDQAIAIALGEAGLSRDSGGRRTSGARDGRAARGPTKAALYAEARRRGIPGRSTMSKSGLQRALAEAAEAGRRAR